MSPEANYKRKFEVKIPNLEGDAIAESVPVEVEVWKDEESGDEILTPKSLELIENTRARYMGLLSPAEIKLLRERLGLTQKQISELLQIGEKTWTRWETGRERPSRSINVLLSALRDGKIDMPYLRSLLSKTAEMGQREFVPYPQDQADEVLVLKETRKK